MAEKTRVPVDRSESKLNRFFGILLGCLGSICLVAPLSAHPGHGEHGAAHHLLAPEHALPIVFLFAMCAFVIVGLPKCRRFVHDILNR